MYIIDAIVRGNNKTTDKNAKIKGIKDMYARRFIKNMSKTFTHICDKCPLVERVCVLLFFSRLC